MCVAHKLNHFLDFFYRTDRQKGTQCLKITEKVSLNIASEASYVYSLSGQKFIKKCQKWEAEGRPSLSRVYPELSRVHPEFIPSLSRVIRVHPEFVPRLKWSI